MPFASACGSRGPAASYRWTKCVLHAAGLVRPALKRSAHRKQRHAGR
jgi:hypothetical protein